MVIDDEEDILKIIDYALKKQNLLVDSFTDPMKAFTRFQNNHSKYFLVICDIRMPGMTGFELVNLMRQIKPEIRILLMTAYLKEEIDAILSSIRKEDIIEKPFRLEELVAAVKKKLELFS